MNRFRHARKVLAASMFVMGACGIAYEYTLGALGNNLMGSSHEQIFVVIGLMMFAMGLGATLQKNISGDLVDKFLLVEILLGLTGGISALVIYLAYVYSSSYMLLLWGFSLGIGILIGLEIPLLIRINREYSAQSQDQPVRDPEHGLCRRAGGSPAVHLRPLRQPFRQPDRRGPGMRQPPAGPAGAGLLSPPAAPLQEASAALLRRCSGPGMPAGPVGGLEGDAGAEDLQRSHHLQPHLQVPGTSS